MTYILTELPASTRNSHNIKMLAIMEQWETGSDCHTENTEKYLLLVLFKLGLDIVIFYLCCRKLCASFLSMCSLSVVLADSVMAVFLATVWFLGAERSPVSTCFLLANASAAYGALPLPMMLLGLLDYCLEDTILCHHSAFCKLLRNAVLILLVWTLSVIYSLATVKAELMELDYLTQVKVLVCEVQESKVISYFVLVLFTAVICATLPFLSNIPQWLKEVNWLSEVREEQESQKSDLFISTNCTETKSSEENSLEETNGLRPPLWFSLTLCFTTFWMPYLSVSAICLAFGLGVPAYITVNLLWLESANSLLMAVVFWAKSNTQGPYSRLPENVCLWRVYWHLSKGVRQQQLPIGVFNPSKGKRTTLLYV